MKKFFILLGMVFIALCMNIQADAKKAPHFVLPDLSGNMVVSDNFIGKEPVLLFFWATW